MVMFWARQSLLVAMLVWIWCSSTSSHASSSELQSEFKIAAFNIQVFGKKKMSKQPVVDVLIKTLRRYDIVLVQEIRDSKQKAVYSLLEQINEQGAPSYDIVVSNRLGRTSSKEQYAYLYRKDAGISVKGEYLYPDPQDKFQREPFAVLFGSENTAIHEFVLAGIHVEPGKAVEEINELDTVFDDLHNHWGNENILIMGDFNADCGYVSNRAYKSLDLRKDNAVHWLVPDDWDTTVKASNCAYDRFVMTGDDFVNAVVPSSARVFYFDQAYGLSYSEAIAVSDHYPIELALQPSH